MRTIHVLLNINKCFKVFSTLTVELMGNTTTNTFSPHKCKKLLSFF